MNWAEKEILRLSKEHGVGEFIFIDYGDAPQAKRYSGIWSSYPDVENRINGSLIMLVEVKSRKEFHAQNSFLALKEKQYKSYKRVQAGEGEKVRLVYLIGTRRNYSLFWSFLDELDGMEYSFENFRDSGDKKEEKYRFFHSSQFRTYVEELFNPII